MKNKILRTGAIALAMIILCGSALPCVSAETTEEVAEAPDATGDTEDLGDDQSLDTTPIVITLEALPVTVTVAG